VKSQFGKRLRYVTVNAEKRIWHRALAQKPEVKESLGSPRHCSRILLKPQSEVENGGLV
jgi:hypothetical protein